MKNLQRILAILLIASVAQYASAQGCSDAGICTLDGFRANQQQEVPEARNYVRLGASIGGADNDISVWSSFLEFGRRINDQISLDAKLTSLAQSGNDISVNGLSDVFVNGHYRVNQKLRLSIGAKIPLNDGNKMLNGISLPMDYQSSLGTFDLVAGLTYTIKKLQCVAAIQQPLSQNKNAFVSTDYSSDSPLRSFQSTKGFERSADAILRFSYPITLSERWQLSPSLLTIYHLGNDTFTGSTGKQEILGSEGVTLNGNIYVEYVPKAGRSVQLVLGSPFVVRDTRPDGLTRSFVAGLEYKHAF